jgi:hypothetical protein
VILTPDQVEAFKALGGCEHTPDPFAACDTCGRPKSLVKHDKVVAYDFEAETVDGTRILKRDVGSFDNLPKEALRRLTVMTDDKHAQRVTLMIDPEKGQTLRRFSRQIRRVSSQSGRHISATTVEVLEVGFDDDKWTRLYLHPLLGPILSTLDLWF